MMNEEEIKKTVFALLKKIAPDTKPEELKPEENIRQVLDIDSFDFLQFIVELDKITGTNIPEQDYGKISSLKDLIGYVKQKQK